MTGISLPWEGSLNLRSLECIYIKPCDYLIIAFYGLEEPISWYKETFRLWENMIDSEKERHGRTSTEQEKQIWASGRSRFSMKLRMLWRQGP